MIVAIDGPAGSGKSTLARLLAARYGLAFLDTGLLYRAVARRLVDAGYRCDDPDAAVAAAGAITTADLESPHLRGEGIGNGASMVAAIPRLRAALLPVQRRLAAQGRGSVVAGRDIGSVVLPETPFKFFVTAGLEERARRRFEELRRRGEAPIFAQVMDELAERDRRDESRAIAPMAVAEGAIVVDTSAMDVKAALAAVVAEIERERVRETGSTITGQQP
ncbi:MAG: (d)CMP kinase [Geminicoccaceae bacterium]|nr:(d)CMP kinase [Geminicoccaceae bacterium]